MKVIFIFTRNISIVDNQDISDKVCSRNSLVRYYKTSNLVSHLGSLQTLWKSKRGITSTAFKSPATATALQICQREIKG